MTGMIEIDSERGKQLGFTSDRFTLDSYLWEEPDRIMVSLIQSRKPGSFKALVAAILADGKCVAVPTPLGDMQRIVEKNGYVHTVEDAGEMGPCHIWTCSPTRYRNMSLASALSDGAEPCAWTTNRQPQSTGKSG